MNKNSKKVVAGLATGMAVAGIVGGAFAFRQVHPVWNQTTKVATDTKQKQAKKEEITLHYRWTGTETPHIYYENVNGSGDKAISYPGIPMKKTGKDWYSYTISNAKSADIIFSAGENYETATLSREAGEWWLDQDTWYAENPDGSQEENLQLASNSQTGSQQAGENETYRNLCRGTGFVSCRRCQHYHPLLYRWRTGAKYLFLERIATRSGNRMAWTTYDHGR